MNCGSPPVFEPFGFCSQLPPSIAGPGFINLKLRPEFVGASLEAMRRDPERLNVPEATRKQRVVVSKGAALKRAPASAGGCDFGNEAPPRD